jgi:phosphoribosylanthranilate isomerase
MTVIKICGIKSLSDAVTSLEAGVEYLGFNFYPVSPRSITPQACKVLIANLPARFRDWVKVGVFVNRPIDEVGEIVAYCGLDMVQFSGDEKPEDIHRYKGTGFKALKPRDMDELADLVEQYKPVSPATPEFLIDANAKGSYGGTGKLADWGLASLLVNTHAIFLAGGLKPENVGQAIRQVHPWGVDVASGVELSPGKKDADRIQDFVLAVHNADAA